LDRVLNSMSLVVPNQGISQGTTPSYEEVQEGDVVPVGASEEGAVTSEDPESRPTAAVDAALEVTADGDPFVDSTSELPPPE
jgi:hypothetical protein